MIWAIDNDDFMPECSNVRYPLLKAINAEFKAAASGSTVPDKEPTTTVAPEKKDPKDQPGKASSISFNLLLSILTSVIVAFSISYWANIDGDL